MTNLKPGLVQIIPPAQSFGSYIEFARRERGSADVPDADKILRMIERAAILNRAHPQRRGAVIHLDRTVEDLVIVGDLHGNLDAFRMALQVAALDRYPGRHLILQEPIHGPWTYPENRGDRSHQLLDVFCALKLQYLDRVHYILGNHELSEQTGRRIIKHDTDLSAQFYRGIQTAYQDQAAKVHQGYCDLFASLPLAVRTENRGLICHTIPEARDLDRPIDLSVLDTGRWSDEQTKRGGTVYALTWGRDNRAETTERFLQLVDADVVINGHQVYPEGFAIPHPRRLIVDGTQPRPTCSLLSARTPLDQNRLAESLICLTTGQSLPGSLRP